MAYRQYNANPVNKRVGDCTVRAISKALDQPWEVTYVGIALEGFLLCDMPSANHVWGSYLRDKGYTRRSLPNECPDCYTVADFCHDHPKGTFVLALSGHVLCVCDGDHYDTWDSGGEVPLYYWERKEE